jgi:hypothetical protein
MCRYRYLNGNFPLKASHHSISYLSKITPTQENCMASIRLLFVGLLLASVQQTSAQTAPDIYDTVLVTYKLSSVQEAQFNAHNGALAAFWTEWDTQNASALTRDYIQMDPAHSAQPGRDYYTGPQDNTLLIKAAYGQAGVYLLVEMIDDDFLDRNMGNTDTLHRDAIELYIDTMSSAENRAGGSSVYIGLYDATLTYTSVQFLLSMGRNQVYSNFRMSYYSNSLWSWQDDWTRFDTAEQRYNGMAFETVPVSTTRRAQEWFLPWTWVGQGGPAGGMPALGRRFAFAGGCHDMDSLQRDTVCSLKWKNRGNPFGGRVNGQYNNTWGDLEMGPPLSSATEARRTGQSLGEGGHQSRIVRTEVWTLDGRLLAGPRQAANSHGNLTLLRDVLANGALQVRLQQP